MIVLRRLAAAEPVRLAAAIRALLIAAVAFGLDVSEEQIVAVVVAVEVVSALFVRSRVTPAEPGPA